MGNVMMFERLTEEHFDAAEADDVEKLALEHPLKHITAGFTWKMLSAKEEFSLATRYRDHDDAKAAEELVLAYQPLALRIASEHRHYGLPVEDLFQEGQFGLINAVRRFDPTLGVRLHAFAEPHIEGGIRRYVMENISSVKIGKTENERKLFWKLPWEKAKLYQRYWGSMPDEVQVPIIAKQLDVPEKDVWAMWDRGADFSADEPLRDDNNEPIREDDYTVTLIDRLGHRDDPEKILMHKQDMDFAKSMVSEALGVLDDVERRVFEAYHLANPDDRLTMAELGRELGISTTTVWRITKRSHEKVKEALQAHAEAYSNNMEIDCEISAVH
jgi:RNA polymerase sigma-32 factor